MKRICIFIAVCLTIIMFIGCEQSVSLKKNDLEEVSIMLDWYPNAVHSSLYYAKEKGYFEEEGLHVTIKMPAETNDPLKLAATGKVDLAISYQSEVALSKSEGIPVVSMAALVRESLSGIFYKKESDITSPKDLEGKTIGYAGSQVSEVVVNTMVENAGGDPEKIELMDVGWDLIPAIATDNVDALTSGYINHELVLLRKEGHDIEVDKPADFGVPKTYELILVTGEKKYNEKKETFEKFWRALTKGQEAVKENPEKGLQVLLDHEEESFPLDKEVEKESLEILLPLMESDNLSFGYQEKESWERVINWLAENDMIEESFETEEVMKNIMEK